MEKVLILSAGDWGGKPNHEMVNAGDWDAEAAGFRELRTAEQVFDRLERRFHELGGTQFLATGIPLPGRAVTPLVLRVRWGAPSEGRLPEEMISAADTILALALRIPRADVIAAPSKGGVEGSELSSTALALGADTIVCVPIRAFLPFQGVVVAAGRAMPLDRLTLTMLDYLCEEAFRRLFAIRALAPERQGDLSPRERWVVSLSAEGKTASDIAKLLAISQRTVHAHLQNACDKLRAKNKTQTVLEALRYGQITL